MKIYRKPLKLLIKTADFGATDGPPSTSEAVYFIHSLISVIRYNSRKNLMNRFRETFRSVDFGLQNDLSLQFLG